MTENKVKLTDLDYGASMLYTGNFRDSNMHGLASYLNKNNLSKYFVQAECYGRFSYTYVLKVPVEKYIELRSKDPSFNQDSIYDDIPLIKRN